jgi:hypothetical protein
MTPNERPRDYESFQVRIVHQLGAAKAHGFSPATLLASAEKVIEQSRLRCLLLADFVAKVGCGRWVVGDLVKNGRH